MTTVIDPDTLIGTPLPGAAGAWTDKDVMLYQLGLGAGIPPTDPRELRYTFERDLMVLPSFASVACHTGLIGFRRLPQLDLSNVVVLHAEHLVETPAAIPAEAEVEHDGGIIDVIDRERGALVLFEVNTRDRTTGQLYFRNVASFYLKGLGGFGGKAGSHEKIAPPDRGPDVESAVTLLPNQALIYRLSGDRNPMHVDPEAAAKAGFPQPLLHGLCTYGVVCKQVVDSVLEGEVSSMRSYRGRFTGNVFPSETLEVQMWREGDLVTAVASTVERGDAVFVGEARLG
jgi:acyl dehydratase